MPTELDWAKLAAFIDGEGHIGSSRQLTRTGKREHFSVVVAITNTDPRLIVWLAKTFGGKIHRATRITRTGKTVYRWQVWGKESETVLRGCLLHFIIKRDQAEIALAIRETVNLGFGKHSQLPDEIVEYRRELHSKLLPLRTLPSTAEVERMIQ